MKRKEHLIVDKEKCNHDAICTMVCPIEILEMQDGYPQYRKGAHLLCINCGHCICACPKGAIELLKMPKESCLELDDFSKDASYIEKFLRQRRSIRVYKNKKVEKNFIKKTIDIARHAPSGHNTQPLSWLVAYNEETVKKANLLAIDWMKEFMEKNPSTAHAFRGIVLAWEKRKKNMITRDAPHLIICHADKKIPTAPIAGYTAFAYLELAANSLSLGTCWAGYLNLAINEYAPLKELLGIPENHACYGTIMIGYPKFKYYRTPARNKKEIRWV